MATLRSDHFGFADVLAFAAPLCYDRYSFSPTNVKQFMYRYRFPSWLRFTPTTPVS